MTNPQMGFAELTTNQEQPEVLVNAADRFITNILTGQISIEFASDADITLSAPAPLTTAAQWPYAVIRMTDSPTTLTAPRSVVYPNTDSVYGGPSRHHFTFRNDTGQSLTIKRSGQTGVTVAAGAESLVRHNGTDIVAVTSSGGGGSSPGDIATEILADSPTAYWKLNETSGTNWDDSTAGNQDLTTTGSPDLAWAFLIPHSSDKFVRIPNGSGTRLTRSGFTATAPATGDWTQECIVMLQGPVGTTYRLLGFNTSGGSTINAWTITSSGEPGTIWNASPQQTTAPLFLPIAGIPFHLAIIKDGTANTVTYYVNGRKIAAVSYATEPNLSGSGGTLFVGSTPAATATGPFVLGHLAYYDGVKLSDTRIMAHAKAALA